MLKIFEELPQEHELHDAHMSSHKIQLNFEPWLDVLRAH